MLNQMLEKSIHRAQHCQRNWDLTQQIPEKDLQTIKVAASCAPTKQNLPFFNAYFITDRKIIEEIHGLTEGFYIKGERTTNPQTLANVLIAFVTEWAPKEAETDKDMVTANRAKAVGRWNYRFQPDGMIDKGDENFKRDQATAVGVAAGFVNVTSSMLGYATGCCQCFDESAVKKVLKLDGQGKGVALLMGVGIPGEMPRRTHHLDPSLVFPTFKNMKQSIDFNGESA